MDIGTPVYVLLTLDVNVTALWVENDRPIEGS
jgi:hypothetical protein